MPHLLLCSFSSDFFNPSQQNILYRKMFKLGFLGEGYFPLLVLPRINTRQSMLYFLLCMPYITHPRPSSTLCLRGPHGEHISLSTKPRGHQSNSFIGFSLQLYTALNNRSSSGRHTMLVDNLSIRIFSLMSFTPLGLFPAVTLSCLYLHSVSDAASGSLSSA